LLVLQLEAPLSRAWRSSAIVVLALIVALSGAVAVAQQTQTPTSMPTELYCPGEGVVAEASGTYVCVSRLENFTVAFASFYLSQSGDSLTFAVYCFTVGGCKVHADVYSLNLTSRVLARVASLSFDVEEGGFAVRSVAGVAGTGVVNLTVNDVYMGFYAPLHVPVDAEVPATLRDIAGRDPLLTAVAGLLVIAVPLGWLLQRELGVAGLALAAMSMPFYTLTYALTGDVAVSMIVAALSAFVGLVLLVAYG